MESESGEYEEAGWVRKVVEVLEVNRGRPGRAELEMVELETEKKSGKEQILQVQRVKNEELLYGTGKQQPGRVWLWTCDGKMQVW